MNHPTSGTRKTWSAKKPGKDGYVIRKWWSGPRPDRRLLQQQEHRWVWEDVHGEKVPEGYDIHHLNGDRRDNRPENLEAVLTVEHDQLHALERRKTHCKCGAPLDLTRTDHSRTLCRACRNAYHRELRVRQGGHNRPERAYGCQCHEPRTDPKYGWCIDCKKAYDRARYAAARGGQVRHYRPRAKRESGGAS